MPGQVGKVVQDLGVNCSLEGHDEGDEFARLGPAPGVELFFLSWRSLNRNFRVRAEKAHGKPFLPLTTVAAAPGDLAYPSPQRDRKD